MSTNQAPSGTPYRPATVLTRNFIDVWFMGRIEALKQVAEDATDNSIKERLYRLIDRQWSEYIALAGYSDSFKSELKAVGLPDSVTLDTTDLSVSMTWNHLESASEFEGRASVSVRSGEFDHWPDIEVSTLFKVVDLNDLTSDSMAWPITDSRHISVAILHEIVSTIYYDATRYFGMFNGEDAWLALNAQASFMWAASRQAMRNLQNDVFRDWQRPSIEPMPFESIAPFVDRNALTTSAQQALSLGLFSALYLEMLENPALIQKKVSDRSQAIIQNLAGFCLRLSNLLGSLNNSVASSKNELSDNLNMKVVFRVLGAQTPMLIATPNI